MQQQQQQQQPVTSDAFSQSLSPYISLDTEYSWSIDYSLRVDPDDAYRQATRGAVSIPWSAVSSACLLVQNDYLWSFYRASACSAYRARYCFINSVCLSVCPMPVGLLCTSKRMDISSHILTLWWGHYSRFFEPNRCYKVFFKLPRCVCVLFKFYNGYLQLPKVAYFETSYWRPPIRFDPQRPNSTCKTSGGRACFRGSARCSFLRGQSTSVQNISRGMVHEPVTKFCVVTKLY